MSPIRILLADDHTVVRIGLRTLIDAQPDMEVVGEARDGAEALAHALRVGPDIVVMDLSMSQLNGLEVTRQLCEQTPELRVLVLSVHEDATYLRQALSAGATGYVLKRAAAEQLIEAIREIAAGKVYLDPNLGVALAQSIAGAAGRGAAGDAATLSERERAVLRMIAQGYSNKEIAARLDVSVKTVETYKARAMEKLGLKSRVDIVRYTAEVGWLSRL